LDPSPPAWSIDEPVRPRLAEWVRLHEDRHTGEMILLYPEGHLRDLSKTGLSILLLCDGRRTLEEITAMLAQAYEGTVDDLRDDVAKFLGQLSDRQFVLLQPEGGIR
jgi:pyrroloquinoline quinone biosynthesis protein D